MAIATALVMEEETQSASSACHNYPLSTGIRDHVRVLLDAGWLHFYRVASALSSVLL